MVSGCALSSLGLLWISVTLFLTSLGFVYALEYGGDWVGGLWFSVVTVLFFIVGDAGVMCVLFELLNLPLLGMLWFRSHVGLKGILNASILLVVYSLTSGMMLVVGVSIQIGLLIGLAAGVKLALVPVHVWLGKVHVECSTLGSVLLAGVALKVGYYVGMLFGSLVYPYLASSTWFFFLGVVVVQLSLLDAVDGKRFVALFSVAHMQVLIIFLGSSGFSLLSSSFVSVGMVAHSLVSAGLFFVVGRLVESLGTRNVLELSIASSSIPFFLLILIASNCALPLSSLFIVEIVGHASLLASSNLLLVLSLLAFTALSFLACVMVLGRSVIGLSPLPSFHTVPLFVASCSSFFSWLVFLVLFTHTGCSLLYHSVNDGCYHDKLC
jgi:NADH-quinone oxidoreductase subunit M